MTNEKTFNYLKKIRNISAALFFVHLFTIVAVTAYLVFFYVWFYNNAFNNSFENIVFLPGSWQWIVTIVFSLVSTLFGVASLGLSVVNIVYCSIVKIDDEPVTVLIVFSVLNLLFIGIAPLVLWILSIKYSNKVEDLESKRLLQEHKENNINTNNVN